MPDNARKAAEIAALPDPKKIAAVTAGREAIARIKEADEAFSSAALIRAGQWDDVSEVKNAIAGAQMALATRPAADPDAVIREAFGAGYLFASNRYGDGTINLDAEYEDTENLVVADLTSPARARGEG